jgi:hypothetical protein
MRTAVFCGLLLCGCNSSPLGHDSGDLGDVDFAVPDLPIGSAEANVETCCGGAPPQCTPAPDGGCQSPMQDCTFGGGGCYLPCTVPPHYTVPIPAPCLGHPTNLCQCIMQNGGADPCYPNGGDSCDYNTTNLPPGEIVCQCY